MGAGQPCLQPMPLRARLVDQESRCDAHTVAIPHDDIYQGWLFKFYDNF